MMLRAWENVNLLWPVILAWWAVYSPVPENSHEAGSEDVSGG